MADETNTPVAGTENATQGEQKTVPFIYYYSDPDESDQLLHHLPIPSFIDLSQQIAAGKLWHIYNIPAPDKDMEDPVIDVRTNTWVENSKNAQTKILTQATQTVKAMQQVQAQSSQQNVAMMKSFTAQTQNTNKMLATMQQTLVMVVKAVQNDTTPKAPKADVPAQPATDKQENGGN